MNIFNHGLKFTLKHELEKDLLYTVSQPEFKILWSCEEPQLVEGAEVDTRL